MNEGYSRERLELFDALLKKRLDVVNGKPWTLEPKHLRFKHGESIAELKVPYHMGADDDACIENAVLGLAALLSKRSEPGVEALKDSSPQPLPVQVSLLKEKTFRTDIFISESLEKKIATETLASTSHIDSAILANWLGSEGHGRKFIKWIGDIFEKTLKDEAKQDGEEKTSYLTLLAAVNTVRKKKEKIKGYRIKGLTYEKLDLVVGLTMFIAFKGALKDLFERLKSANASCYNPSSESILMSAVVPKAFLTIPSNLLSASLNPYGINNETFEILSEKVGGIDNSIVPDESIAAAMQGIKNSPAVEALKLQCNIMRFREEALKYLTEFDLHGIEAHEMLYELYNEDRLIKNLLTDSRTAANLGKALDDVRKKFPMDIQRGESIISFQRFLSSLKKPMFGGLLKSSRKNSAAVLPAIEGYFACVFDDHVEKSESIMMEYLLDRRGEFKQNMLMEEYNRGRLYRFSTDERPLIKTLSIEEEGQLFIDMKDFTRKTLKVKEIAMAEFMREYFYKPILQAANRYGMGTVIVEDESGIRLTNLPGDAAIFSGGVSYLVALAKDIQYIIMRYREQLLKRMPPSQNEEILEEVHQRFEARKDAFRKRRAELNEALEKNQHGVESKLVALGEEEHRLENTYREELQNAIKGELEAGLYISYGSKAETVVIDPREAFSGPVKVSIGEKINEAARGTFRNPMVRAKLEVLLEAEKQKRKQKGVRYPFDIYVDRIYSINMPPELEGAFEKLIASKKPSNAQAISKIMANEFLSDLKMIISGEPFSSLRLMSATTDIYNKGEAISLNALEAYMKETRGTKWFFHKTVDVSELDPAIQETFFFPSDPLEFWFGVETLNGVERLEGFYKSGEVIFKGFEANTPMVVYEILNTEGEFFKAAVKHHARNWIEDARKANRAETF